MIDEPDIRTTLLLFQVDVREVDRGNSTCPFSSQIRNLLIYIHHPRLFRSLVMGTDLERSATTLNLKGAVVIQQIGKIDQNSR